MTRRSARLTFYEIPDDEIEAARAYATTVCRETQRRSHERRVATGRAAPSPSAGQVAPFDLGALLA